MKKEITEGFYAFDGNFYENIEEVIRRNNEIFNNVFNKELDDLQKRQRNIFNLAVNFCYEDFCNRWVSFNTYRFLVFKFIDGIRCGIFTTEFSKRFKELLLNKNVFMGSLEEIEALNEELRAIDKNARTLTK